MPTIFGARARPTLRMRSTSRSAECLSNSASGNPFQPTFFYHGFAASPLQGTPQGLAVYVNGIRFNQPFGDTVDWDLLPNIAIDSVNIEGSNPVFGLNALGGSVNVRLKDGFAYHGFEADVSGGSFGQIQGEFQFGKQSGNASTYVAGSVLHQDGWRDLQSSDLQNFFGDAGWRSERAELHLNVTVAHDVLNGPGTAPVQLLAADQSAQFTAPNQISNQYGSVSLTGNVDVTETTSVQALVYYRYFLQRVMNGNAPNDTPCNDGSGLLCSGPGVYSTTLGGATIPDFLNGGPIFRARPGDHKHQCLWRVGAGHQYRRSVRLEEPSGGGDQLRRGANRVQRCLLCRRADHAGSGVCRARGGAR